MHRREWVRTAGLTALAGVASPATVRAAAKVTVEDFEVHQVNVNRRGRWVTFRMQTNEGLTGIGDASHSTHQPEPAIAYAREFFEHLRGQSIFDVERFRQAVLPAIRAKVSNRGELRRAAVAFSALEQCLWDLQGKALGVPCYELFGGKLRDRIRCYANINRSTTDRTPAGFAATAERAVEAGFDAIKMASFDGMPRLDADAEEFEKGTRSSIACIEAVREVIGPERDLLVDAHSRFDRERGIALARRLEPLKLFWLEEAARPVADLAAINKAVPMPTAGGESLFGVESFFAYIAAGAVDIIMPDVKFCGGMLELKKIAALAEGAGLLISPHGPASPVGNMAAAHVCATMPNFQILEFGFGEVPWRAEVVDPPEAMVNGYLQVPDRPGLGYEINEKTFREHAV